MLDAACLLRAKGPADVQVPRVSACRAILEPQGPEVSPSPQLCLCTVLPVSIASPVQGVLRRLGWLSLRLRVSGLAVACSDRKPGIWTQHLALLLHAEQFL